MSSYPDAIASVKKWLQEHPDASEEHKQTMEDLLKQLLEGQRITKQK